MTTPKNDVILNFTYILGKLVDIWLKFSLI